MCVCVCVCVCVRACECVHAIHKGYISLTVVREQWRSGSVSYPP